MRRLRLLQAPVTAAFSRLVPREACGVSLHGAAATPISACCAVRHATGAAVDTFDSGAAPSGASPAASAAGAAGGELAALLHTALSRHGQVRAELVQQARACSLSVQVCVADAPAMQVLQHEPALAATTAARLAAAERFALLAKVAPGFWQHYTPRVSAMLLAGGPRLFERLVQEAAAGTALTVPYAPSPALVAHLAERGAVVAPGTEVGDCTPEEEAPKRSQKQALLDAERRLWELEDEEHDDAAEGGASDGDDGEDSPPGPSGPPRRAARRQYPRGSPPPRAGRSPRRSSRRK